MIIFSIDNVYKAVLAGYATNTALNTSNLLLMQYVLQMNSPTLDDGFGGFNGDPEGVAMSNNPSQGYTVGRQSMGRFIVGGWQQGVESTIMGLLQAYTSSGLLDQSFGQNGLFTQGTTGIYATVIDSQDRVIIAYTTSGDLRVSRVLADGSGIDLSFNSDGTPGYYLIHSDTYTVGSNNNYRLAIDQSGNIFIVTLLTTTGPAVIGLTILDNEGAFLCANTFNASAFGELSDFTITKLLITASDTIADESIILVGYDQVTLEGIPSHADQVMVASFITDGTDIVLNTSSFNVDGTPGYIKYAVANGGIQQTAGAVIHPDGRIIIAGVVNDIVS